MSVKTSQQIIRPAVIEDLPSLLEIYNHAVRTTVATFDLAEFTLDQRRAWFSHYGGKYPLIVAERAGRIVGYASLSRYREKAAYDRTVESSVYIHPDFQGQGVGKALMVDILAQAVSLGHHVVIAGITGGNDASVRLHVGLGFELVGAFREVGWKFDQWQDVHFYQLILPGNI